MTTTTTTPARLGDAVLAMHHRVLNSSLAIASMASVPLDGWDEGKYSALCRRNRWQSLAFGRLLFALERQAYR